MGSSVIFVLLPSSTKKQACTSFRPSSGSSWTFITTTSCGRTTSQPRENISRQLLSRGRNCAVKCARASQHQELPGLGRSPLRALFQPGKLLVTSPYGQKVGDTSRYTKLPVTP